MNRTKWMRLLSILLVLCLVGGLFPIAASAQQTEENAASIVRPDMSFREVDIPEEEQGFSDTDVVRISLVLEEPSVLDAGYSLRSISDSRDAVSYRTKLLRQQAAVERRISRQLLDGEPVDVAWNLTLAGNILSVNLPYGKLAELSRLPGVRSAQVECRYEVPVETPADGENELNTIVSSGMTGTAAVWESGYTGAGSRIAIIDTGTDPDHQSFSADAFDYALRRNAEEQGQSEAEYRKGLNLLTSSEIASVLTQLNAYQRLDTITADELYVSDKLPFGFNYADLDTNISHDYDSASAHGSHVAGIAAANRYLPGEDGQFVSSAESVHVCGAAPDAQIITMKVAGKAGTIYDSDYMAAIEDALILKADSINLSLGSVYPGFAYNDTYASLLDALQTYDVVVNISAGNSSYWAEHGAAGGYLYADGVSYATGGMPGTYQNALTVASVDNNALYGAYIGVAGQNIVYTESSGGSNDPMTALDTSADHTGTDYGYVLLDGYAASSDEFSGIDVKGKIVLCSRGGGVAFTDKANLAASLGAVGIIIYNNTSGRIKIGLSGYGYTAPVVSVSQAEGEQLRSAAQKQTGADGTVYYTGTLTVYTQSGMGKTDETYTMSSFSSWGVPGSLELKPEITAPGGSIYSVDGSVRLTDQYTTMSGTSMASPQVAGISALMAQYIRQNDLKRTGLSARQLSQSLLMSTAEPMKDANGSYYSLLQQGAGLVRVDEATKAQSYLLVDGQPDGKVKAEFGDDPSREGVYHFRFTLSSLSGTEQVYQLRSDFFTQGVFEQDGQWYLDTATVSLPVQASYAVSGESLQDGTLRLPANGSVSVDVTLTLPAETRAALEENHPNGAYLQAYVFVDGENDVTHSVPVVGYYGSWTEPSMYDVGSYYSRTYGTDTRTPYVPGNDIRQINLFTIRYGGAEKDYIYGVNPVTDETSYHPERNAMNNLNGDAISGALFSLVRSAGNSLLRISNAETGEVYHQNEMGSIIPAFYLTNTGNWQYTYANVELGWDGTDSRNQPLPEGTQVQISVVAAPEYYRSDDGSYRWDDVQQGAYLSTVLTIDNTAPEITSVELSDDGSHVTVTAKDNGYISALALLTCSGQQVLQKAAPEQSAPGQEVSATFSLEGVSGTYIQVAAFDYAMNSAGEKVKNPASEQIPQFTAAKSTRAVYIGYKDSFSWLGFNTGDTQATQLDDVLMDSVCVAAFAGGHVFAIDESNRLYVMSAADLCDATFLVQLDNKDYPISDFRDLAFDVQTQKLYGLYYSDANKSKRPYLCEIDPLMATMTVLGELGADIDSITIDGEGTFYGIAYGKGDLYRYTLASYQTPEKLGTLGKLTSRTRNTLEWDHASGKLYWSYTANSATTVYEINLQKLSITAVAKMAFTAIGLFTRNELCADLFETRDHADTLTVSPSQLTLMSGESAALTADIWPWTAKSCAVTWTSSDTSVATVDQNGCVTTHRPGTAVITAAAQGMQGSCTLTVASVDKELHAVLWDADANTWLVRFNTNSLPSYEKITEKPLTVGIQAMTRTENDVFYGATFNATTGSSDLYRLDLASMQTELIGSSQYYYSDLAYSPTCKTLLATNSNYLLSVDMTTGQYNGNWSVTSETDEYLVGVAYLRTEYSERLDTNIDLFLTADQQGNVYLYGLFLNQGEITLAGMNDGAVKSLGFQTESSMNNSLYSDGQYLFWSRYSERENRVEIIAWDYNGTDAVHSLGGFEADVWPVCGFYEPAAACEHAHTERRGAVEPTCTKAGRTGELYCLDCGEKLEDSTDIPAIACASAGYTDVSSSAWYHDAVDYVIRNGIMIGQVEGEVFAPDANITRAELVMTLYRLSGQKAGSLETPFADVSESAWYAEAVAWAYQTGVVKGVSETSFAPEAPASRQEAVCMIYRFLNGETAEGDHLASFTDKGSVADWAYDAVNWAVANGLIVGVGENQLSPLSNIRRCEFAQLAMRMHRS